jgi:hypothetical protein
VLHLVFKDIARAQQPFRAVQLKTLVVAVRERRLLTMVAIAPEAYFRTINAVSISPASPIAGSTRLLPWAYTDTGSSPMMKRAISKSWMVISRNMPPETRTYSAGGGDGSREMISSDSGLPMRPACVGFHTAELRVKAAVKADEQRHVVLFDHFQAVAHDPGVGFSQKMALPWRAAISIRSAWVSVAEAISTA